MEAQAVGEEKDGDKEEEDRTVKQKMVGGEICGDKEEEDRRVKHKMAGDDKGGDKEDTSVKRNQSGERDESSGKEHTDTGSTRKIEDQINLQKIANKTGIRGKLT